MKQKELLCERRLSYNNGACSIYEKYSTLECVRDHKSLSARTYKLNADKLPYLMNRSKSPGNSSIQELIEYFGDLNTTVSQYGFELSVFITYKAVVRHMPKRIKNCFGESLARIVLRCNSIAIAVEDIPYCNELDKFKINIKIVLDYMLANAKIAELSTVNFAGAEDIIFSPQAAAFFFHEIIGHMLEMDSVMSGNSIYTENDIGARIFDIDIDVVEEPAILTELGIDAGVTDDVGAVLARKELVSGGVLKSFIENKRFDAIDHNPQVRMYSLYAHSNSASISYENFISNAKNAILVRSICSGSVSYNTINAIFKLNCNLCEHIKHGVSLGKVNNLVISGDVRSIKDKLVIMCREKKAIIGHCVKGGQTVTVGQCAAAIVLCGKGIDIKYGH